MDPSLWTAPCDMEWRQPLTSKSEYELWKGGEQVAALRNTGWFAQKTSGETGFQDIVIISEGFLRQRFLIRDAQIGFELATVIAKSWSGEKDITLTRGPQFSWKTKSMWKGISAVVDLKGNEIVEIAQGLNTKRSGLKDWFKTQGRVHVTPHNHSPEHLSLLTLLGWFFVLQDHDSSSTSSIIVT